MFVKLKNWLIRDYIKRLKDEIDTIRYGEWMEAASNDGVSLVPATFTSRQINYENWKIERSDE